MSLSQILYISFFSFIFSIIRQCPTENQDPPTLFSETKTYSYPTVTDANGNEYKQLKVGTSIFIHESIEVSTVNTQNQENNCPTGFRVPLKKDFTDLISNLGTDAYETLVNPDGFNLKPNVYAITDTKSDDNAEATNFYCLYANETSRAVSIKAIDLKSLYKENITLKCVIENLTPSISMNPKNDTNIGDTKTFSVDENILLGSLWRINNNSSNTVPDNFSISVLFNYSGLNMIENWAYDLAGELHYTCFNLYVDNSFNFTLNEINMANDYSIVNTTIQSDYNNKLHFTYSNAVVAPRTHGSYYVAFRSLDDSCIHVLSYDKNNTLLKNFNTNIKGYVYDITATSIGFALYLKEETSVDTLSYSYLLVYNIEFKLVKKKIIINNDSTNKNGGTPNQITRYNSVNKIESGMEYMYEPTNAQLLYSGGYIYLHFSYFNYFNETTDLNGDSLVIFDDTLSNTYFGPIFNVNQSLIHSMCEDKDYVYLAVLSDVNKGINASRVSKTEIDTSDYDSVAGMNNKRKFFNVPQIIGDTIENEGNGTSLGKFGGLFYFSLLSRFGTVYSNFNSTGENYHITIALFNIIEQKEDNKVSYNIDINTYHIRTFESDADIYQVRVGKIGDDLIILYSITGEKVDKNYGDLPKGSPTSYMIVSWDSANNNFTATKYNGTSLGKGRIPTNEALKNFKDGRLIWASVDENNYLIINRLGTLADYNDNLNDDDEEVYNEFTSSSSTDNSSSREVDNGDSSNDNSKGNNKIDDDDSSDSDDKHKKTMLILIIILVILVIIGIVIAVVCIVRDRNKGKDSDKVQEETNIQNDNKTDKKENEKKESERKKEDDERTSNLDNDPHASAANLQSNNNIKIYSSLEKK
jgi:uncharacterized protein YxeA